jgi:hypothetical protein
LIFILLFSGFISITAQNTFDSVFKQCSYAISGEIKNISGSIIDDVGTELFIVDIEIDTVFKQNSHLNIPLQRITWEISNFRCTKANMQDCIKPYMGHKWIFLLFPGHLNGSGDRLDSTRIFQLNPDKVSNANRLAQSEKTCINLYDRKTRCPDDCRFCRNVYNEKWKAVERSISTMKNSGYLLTDHKCVKYVLPIREVQASLPTWGTVTAGFRTKNGIKVKSMTYQIGYYKQFTPLIHIEDVHWSKMIRFEDGEKYESQLLKALKSGLSWQCKDTVRYPNPDPVWDPDSSYIRLWYAQEYYTYCMVDGKYVERFSKDQINCLEKDSFVYSLCLLNMHSHTDVRIWGLQALRRLKDPRCIPYLLSLADFYKDVYVQGDENATIFQRYLEEIITTLDELTGCITVIPFGTDQQQFRLGLGLPVWKSKVVLSSD